MARLLELLDHRMYRLAPVPENGPGLQPLRECAFAGAWAAAGAEYP